MLAVGLELELIAEVVGAHVRIRREVGGRAIEPHAPVEHEHNAISDSEGLAHAVICEEHPEPTPVP